MAEACRLGNHDLKVKTLSNQNENFCVINVLCVFISLVSILADVTTDMIVLAEYCKNGQLYWALGSSIFVITPNVVVNIFSLRWHGSDQKSNIRHWITHGCLVGLLERYIKFLHKVFVCKNLEPLETQKIMSKRNDLSLLHFLYIFTGTVPQIIVQFYAIVILDDNYQTKVFALSASIASVVWGCSTYIYNISVFSNEKFNWSSLLLKMLWNFCMLLCRIQGILLFTIIFDVWTLLPLGLHWSMMTVWIILQDTAFCPNKFEEVMYNIVMGFVYCFFYINLKEGHTRYRLLLFYTLMVTQNFGSLFIYVLISDSDMQKKTWSIALTICILFGTVVGMGAMILYYRFFHSTGPISWKMPQNDIELNNKSITHENKQNNTSLKPVRSFKNSCPQTINNQNDSSSEQRKLSRETTDKKLLLDHWIARSGTPMFTSAPVGNISMDASSIEVYTVENTPQSSDELNKKKSSKLKTNKKRIYAPTELTLKLSCLENIESSIDEITSSNIYDFHKRRGISSADELKDELNNLNLDVRDIINEDFMKLLRNDRSSVMSQDTEGSNKKTSSDSIDMDLDLSLSDINSSDINTFNENIVQKLCLSALKNIKVGNQDADIENIQRIALDILKEMYTKKDKSKNKSFLSKQRDADTPTEILSVHDYENMCAVNIAREAWGLRSWKGYTDIENWIHDGSVVRDRRRDTLTSGSSEVSSCISQDLRNAILSAPSFPKKSHIYSNVFVRFDRTEQEDYANTIISQEDTFLAKPCLADINKDPNHLEPIMEELDDLGDVDPTLKKRLNSESSLVATIDEIRKCTANNSPRIVYHRRDHIWDSPQSKTYNKIENNLRNALWKEPSKFDQSNIMKSLHEKENYDSEIHQSKINKKEKQMTRDLSLSNTMNDIENPTRNNYKNTKRRLKSNGSSGNKVQAKRNNSKSDRNYYDNLDPNNEMNLLWQMVSSESDIDNTQILDSSLRKEGPMISNNSSSKTSNNKKGPRNRPRRKFSILRERFEPRPNSDEEILFQSTETMPTLNLPDINIMRVKNKLGSDITSVSANEKEINVLQEQTYDTMPTPMDDNTKEILKEKRSLFLKQVLSPPKFNTKLKHKV